MISTLNDIEPVRQYLARVGAEPRSLKTAVVKEQQGKYWIDLAVIRITRQGDVTCGSPEYAPTDTEREAIKSAALAVQWPETKPVRAITDPPPMIRDAAPEDVFEFRGSDNMIRMVQVRVQRDEGKAYVPWTYWTDDQWRCAEPDGDLPLYGAHRLSEAGTVFIHEGAKAAARMQWMVDGETPEARQALEDHPWGEEMDGAVHLGWIGGALSPSRTDWSVIRNAGVKRAYIVSDNDAPGVSAVPKISHELRLLTFNVQFSDEWPVSFDLGDNFPEHLFRRGHYVGPAFWSCTHPATWATDKIPPPDGKGKAVTVLREEFKNMWAYVEDINRFVNTEMPKILRSDTVLNRMLAPFSHVDDTCRLIVKAYKQRSMKLCYRPDQKALKISMPEATAINRHVGTKIKARDGDPAPFLEFLAYMFPVESERREVEKWCATLIAKPETRMGYGVLLVSESQGIGKTTLGSQILAPLVGHSNVSFPSEKNIMSPFNQWAANVRLVMVNEIYSGGSWKAYHNLKSVITDSEIEVNEKYVPPYLIENWSHIIAASNSMRALKMESDDRRWLYPTMTEERWPREKFEEFRDWLDAEGLSIIKRWAENYGNYVGKGDRAPLTRRKEEMIDESRSEGEAEAVAIAEVMKGMEEPCFVMMKDVMTWLQVKAQGRLFDTDYQIRRAMKDVGLKVYDKRVKHFGRLQYVMMNEAGVETLKRHFEIKRPEVIRQHAAKVSEFMDQEI